MVQLRDPYPEATLTSPYGPRDLAGGSFHDGVDLARAKGDHIRAAAAGVITALYPEFGEISIRHDDGWATYYAHSYLRSELYVGRRVGAGELIGWCAARGNVVPANAAHLHFMVFKPNGRHTDPLPLIRPQHDEVAMIEGTSFKFHAGQVATLMAGSKMRSRPLIDPATELGTTTVDHVFYPHCSAVKNGARWFYGVQWVARRGRRFVAVRCDRLRGSTLVKPEAGLRAI